MSLDPIAFRDALPSVMLKAQRWLLHDAKKIPHYADGSPRSGTLDSPEDVARLVSFDEAIAAANARGFGIGFALGDGWQGIDLDKHRDPHSGELSTLAERIIEECRAYTETSPSGRGVHILGRGEAFDAIAPSATERRIEAYSGARYFTVTGHALRFPGESADLHAVVERLRKAFVRVNGTERHADPTTDDELRETIRTGRTGVHNALTALAARFAARGMSADDITAALAGLLDACAWKENDAARWHKRRNEVSGVAASAVAKFADPRKREEAPASDKPAAEKPFPAIEWKLPEPISEEEFATAKLAPPCIVENYLFADVAELVAPGGTGKTTEMLYEGIHIGLERSLYGLRIAKPGPVLIITAEDTREMLVARMRAIAESLDLSAEQKAAIRHDVRISDVSGEGLKLTIVAGDVVVPSPAVDTIIEQARRLGPVLVSIDPAISFGVGEARVNDAEQGLIEAARRIRRELGCCVRFVHHSGKQNARDKAVDQYAGRGGSALADGARMVSVMQPMTPEEWTKATGSPLLDGETGMVLARPKLSYCPPQPDILICRKGYQFTHTMSIDRTAGEELAANCEQVFRVIETECAAGKRPTQNSLEVMATSIGRTRQEVRDAVVMLLTHGRIAHAAIVPPPARGARTFLRPAGAPGQSGAAT